VDAEICRSDRVGGQRDKVACHGLGLFFGRQCGRLRHEPCPCRTGIEHGFRRGERLGSHDEQRVPDIHLVQHMAQFVAIDIGDKVKALAGGHPVFEGIHRHLRPQVGAANADVDHIGDERVAPHPLGQRQHGVQRLVHIAQGLLQCSITGQGCRQFTTISRHAQQPVHGRTVLGGVDGFAGKQGRAPGLRRRSRARAISAASTCASQAFLDRSANTWGPAD
jgi:hypothetical protein